jgi:hypothetical protein
MIIIHLGVELGGYSATYAAELARWSAWPIEANFVVKLSPLAFELRIVLEVEGLKMEIAIDKL